MYLPDGTASLALARPGLTIRAMLSGICEKRGLSLPDIKVYLVGNEQVRTWPGRQLQLPLWSSSQPHSCLCSAVTSTPIPFLIP